MAITRTLLCSSICHGFESYLATESRIMMTLVGLFLTATKLAGALFTLSLAANAFSYSRFRKNNLRRFHSPIDESAETLADFNVAGNLQLNALSSSVTFFTFKSLCSQRPSERERWLICPWHKFNYRETLYIYD